MAEPVMMLFVLWTPGGPKEAWEAPLASPGKYDWTICLRRRCGLMSNYFDHLLLLPSAML